MQIKNERNHKIQQNQKFEQKSNICRVMLVILLFDNTYTAILRCVYVVMY